MVVLNKKGVMFPNDNTTMATWLYVQPYCNERSMAANSYLLMVQYQHAFHENQLFANLPLMLLQALIQLLKRLRGKRLQCF